MRLVVLILLIWLLATWFSNAGGRETLQPGELARAKELKERAA
jgi:hypothetical protein